MARSKFETVKGNDVGTGDRLMFHRLKTVVSVRAEVNPFTRYATIKTPWLEDATEIRLDPKQSYKRLRAEVSH